MSCAARSSLQPALVRHIVTQFGDLLGIKAGTVLQSPHPEEPPKAAVRRARACAPGPQWGRRTATSNAASAVLPSRLVGEGGERGEPGGLLSVGRDPSIN